MFLQAGFNPACRARRIVFAMVRRHDRSWVRPAELIQFVAGDFAWYGRGGISWGEQLQVHGFIWPTLPHRRESSRLPE